MINVDDKLASAMPRLHRRWDDDVKIYKEF